MQAGEFAEQCLPGGLSFMTQRKICAVTGSRADYGVLYWLLKEISIDPALELQLVATAMHLSPEFGLTYRQIEEDGFAIDAKVEMLLSSDTPTGIAKSVGLGVIGFADVFHSLQPDVLLLTGDRFETLAAAQTALLAGIRIAHVSGGDTTEGAYDESIRHSLTKMSHLHFVTNELSARRVRQMGENPAHIYNFGQPQLDHVRKIPLLSRAETERKLGFVFRKRNVLVTFHPATLESETPEGQFTELLRALDDLSEDIGLIFTYPNADNHGRILMQMIDKFVGRLGPDRAVARASLGQLLYLSVLAQADILVGNSSSGLVEAPSFQKPAVNVGGRQKGRLRAASVIDCAATQESIKAAMQGAFMLDCSGVVNPYGDGNSSVRIKDVLRDVPLKNLHQKHFYLLEGE